MYVSNRLRLGSVEGSVIQATWRSEFEDDLRTGVFKGSWGTEVWYDNWEELCDFPRPRHRIGTGTCAK